MKKLLIATALLAGLSSGAFATCVHTKLDLEEGSAVLGLHGAPCDPTPVSVPTTSENVLIGLSAMVLALGLIAVKRRGL